MKLIRALMGTIIIASIVGVGWTACPSPHYAACPGGVNLTYEGIDSRTCCDFDRHCVSNPTDPMRFTRKQPTE